MNLHHSLSFATAAVCIAASFAAHAGEPRATACSLNLQLTQGSVSAPVLRFSKDAAFTIVDGGQYVEEFGTITRLRELTVTAVPGDNKAVTIEFALFADVGVFDWIDFRTELNVGRDDTPYVSKGSSSYGNTTSGDHFTQWTITCQRVRN